MVLYYLHPQSSQHFNFLYLCQEQLLLSPFFLLQYFTLVSNIPAKDIKVSLVSIFIHNDMRFSIVREFFFWGSLIIISNMLIRELVSIFNLNLVIVPKLFWKCVSSSLVDCSLEHCSLSFSHLLIIYKLKHLFSTC